MVRVLVVEDHPIMRLGLITALGLEKNVEVVGEATDATEAIRLTEQVEPDLAVVDLRLGGESGVELCRRMKTLPVSLRVLVYTAFNSQDEVQSCLLAGADSYVYKGEGPDKLREAVVETSAGKRVWLLGGDVEETVLNSEYTREIASLTSREREILQLLLKNESNARIAKEISVSGSTLKTHVGHIFKKLGVSSREELLRKRFL